MIAVLMLMSDMTFHTISWDMVGLDLLGLSLVSLAHGMQRVRSLCAWFLVLLQVGCQ
jgi:hypothetical protein